MPEPIEQQDVDALIRATGSRPSDLIPILQTIQRAYNYLPQMALRRVSEVTGIRPAVVIGVATFYNFFRLKPAGRHRICVCHGTPCHVQGSERRQQALERHLQLAAGQDTDADGIFTVERVACVGCCSLAPVVVIDDKVYGYLTANVVPETVRRFLAEKTMEAEVEMEQEDLLVPADAPEVRIGVGSCCVANGSLDVQRAVENALRRSRLLAHVRPVACAGMCYDEPFLEIVWPNGGHPATDAPSLLAACSSLTATDAPPPGSAERPAAAGAVVYARVQPDDVERILFRHLPPRSLTGRLRGRLRRAIETLALGAVANAPRAVDVGERHVRDYTGRQVRLATEHCGALDPLDLDAYERNGGFAALTHVIVELGAEATLACIGAARLRGRGGAGFPTANKWALARASAGDVKYVICNGDEGDPGAFMDRLILESYPFRVLEGLAIAAYAVGAHEGYVYVRAEYPLAVRRVREAIQRLEERGWLGPHMCDGRWSLRLHVKEGAGAFVCGEETALIASIEGRRGMPRLRPPYPTEKGLWNCPTVVNNVETLALVPWILRHGAEAFTRLGTAQSPGTKVFSLTGKIRRGGLIEVPMGISIHDIVTEIGGGIPENRAFKGVQIGGPSGGCLPASLCGLPVDYEALAQVGAIMGSGGLVVLDERDCMVDIARYFLAFTQDQSCGQCTFCRVGTRRMLDILERLCAGQAKSEDIDRLEHLAGEVQRGSLCGLGQTAPNPVLTSLRYFRHEYEEHVQGRCPAGKCTALIQYVVTDQCIGCTLCAQACPVNAIAPAPYRQQRIDMSKCTRCDVCRQQCPAEAIQVQ